MSLTHSREGEILDKKLKKKKKLKENNLHSISIYLPTYLSSFYLYYWFNLSLNTAIK